MAYSSVSYAKPGLNTNTQSSLNGKDAYISFESNAFTGDISGIQISFKKENGWILFSWGLININPVSEDLGTVETAFVQNQNKTAHF